MYPVYRIRPWAGGWSVFVGNQNAAVEPLRTPADAVVHAKEIAKRSDDGAQICVYDEEGELVNEFFLQAQERVALDREEAVPALGGWHPVRRRAPRPGA